MELKPQLKRILEDVLVNYEHIFLVDIHQHQNEFEFTLDGDQLLGIHDISSISRQFNKIADELLPEAEYSIDIATPGADSPIKLFRQYPKHVGREFQVTLNTDNQSFNGKLIAVEEPFLTFEFYKVEKPKKKDLPEQIKLTIDQIKQAQIILSFK